MLKSQQSNWCLKFWGLLQLQFALSINLSKHTEGVTCPHCSFCAYAVPMWAVISSESLTASRWARQVHSGGQSLYDVLCETGMEAACGLLEETTGILSCFLYYDIFLCKPTLSPQFILHECYPIRAGFEKVYLKWWAWLCCRVSGPKPSSPSHLPLCHSTKVG